MNNADDPAGRIPRNLLPHIHLVSSHRFPSQTNLPLQTVINYLVEAPKITRDVAPMRWEFLDAPSDGTVMLEWQPLSRLGTHAASDGYVWAGPEEAFNQQFRGYNVEVYYQRSGYQPRHENVAVHSRKRYRLVPAATHDSTTSSVDAALWIVHYAPAENQSRLPVSNIMMTPEYQNSISQREYLRHNGLLLQRKDFMLNDRNNWPTVNMPGTVNAGQPWPAMSYPNNVMAHMNRNQQPYMMPQNNISQSSIGPSPSKRQRQVGPTHGHAPGRAIPQVPPAATFDEEDIGTGDAMDTLTPRDMSANRYMQHHEWMEEIFSSPYATSQIIPVELGLGRKGEIESLTREFFNAPTNPTSPTNKDTSSARVGRLEAGKADDFSQQATQRVAQIQAEMESLKRQHARRMAKLNKGLAIKQAEQKLKGLSVTGSDKNGLAQPSKSRNSNVADLLGNLESELGKGIKVLKEINCVQKGGLEEKQQLGDGLRGLEFEDMADFGDQQVNPTSFTTPQPGSSKGYGSAGQTPHEYAPLSSDGAAKMETVPVSLTETAQSTEFSPSAVGKEAEAGDWIMVEKEGEAGASMTQATPDVDSMMNDTGMDGALDIGSHDLDTAGAALQDFAPDTAAGASEDFNPTDFGEGVDFGNLDTAGEALSGYGEAPELGLDESGDLGLDDSAFGEAFDATEPTGGQHENDPEI